MKPAMMPRRRRPAQMVGCMEVVRHLDAYLDGELEDRASALRIAEHLDVCQDCGLEARTVAILKADLRQIAPALDQSSLERLRTFARGLQSRRA